jgi:MATE family multidrug resistance protein
MFKFVQHCHKSLFNNLFSKNNFSHHKNLLALAWPMILSNITVPLLGLVDTAVIGHLDNAYYLAGVAIGTMVISLIFWLFSFLRMSTTGLTAHAFGAKDNLEQMAVLKKGLVLSAFFAVFLLCLQPIVVYILQNHITASKEALEQAQIYFSIRIFSAPAALTNLVLLGWMLGMQYAKGPVYLLLVTNITNIVLDVIFVVLLDFGVAGAAWASVIADYLALFFALFLVSLLLKKHGLSWLKLYIQPITKLKETLSLNRDIFIRSLFLQVCFAFITYYGGRLGDNILAANAILLNFLLLVSFALDGVAYAVEAKVGEAKGQKNITLLKLWVNISLFWGMLFSILYSLGFAIFADQLIILLTDIPEVVTTAQVYVGWSIILPMLAVFCFIFDGVFIGLTRAKEMRNAMIFSSLIGFFAVFLILESWENHALWAAMSSFMLLRGLTLIKKYRDLVRCGLLIPEKID